MSYQALYRKFRPAAFGDVKGQDAIVTTLKNQILSDRVGHAYLFTGTRGTGKTTVAKIFARAVNCESPREDGSPCGECEMCRGIADGSLMNVIELDAASNSGVDNIRTIINEVSYSPPKGKYKIYIIDEAHMLSSGAGGAFNALLKTLEEPPPYVIFILATTEVSKIPITILSRCQRYDFRRMNIETMVGRMKELISIEKADVEDAALRFIARTADGSMRDALSLLDQCLAFHYGETLTFDKALDVLGAVDNTVYSDFMQRVLKQDLTGAIAILDDQVMRGREIGAFINDLVWYIRNIMLLSSADKSSVDIAEVLGVSQDTLEQLKELSKKTETETLMRFIQIFSELSGEIRYSPQKRVLTEIAIVKMMRPQMGQDITSLTQRVAQLERKLNRIESEGVKLQKSGKQEPKLRKPEAPVPEALPEDVELVVSSWEKLVSKADSSIKALLSEASPSTDGKMLILKLTNPITEAMLMSDVSRELLEKLFEEELHRKVAYRIYAPGEGEGPNEKYPDLSSFIKFDIETAEDGEE